MWSSPRTISEAAKLADTWLNPKQGTDAAIAMAFGHVILKEFHLDNPSEYFTDYVRRYSDMPMLVMLEEYESGVRPARFLRASDLAGELADQSNAEWKTIGLDENSGDLVSPQGSVGYRWDGSARWNMQEREGSEGREVKLQLSLLEAGCAVASVAFPYFANEAPDGVGAPVGGERPVSQRAL